MESGEVERDIVLFSLFFFSNLKGGRRGHDRAASGVPWSVDTQLARLLPAQGQESHKESDLCGVKMKMSVSEQEAVAAVLPAVLPLHM